MKHAFLLLSLVLIFLRTPGHHVSTDPGTARHKIQLWHHSPAGDPPLVGENFKSKRTVRYGDRTVTKDFWVDKYGETHLD